MIGHLPPGTIGLTMISFQQEFMMSRKISLDVVCGVSLLALTSLIP